MENHTKKPESQLIRVLRQHAQKLEQQRALAPEAQANLEDKDKVKESKVEVGEAA